MVYVEVPIDDNTYNKLLQEAKAYNMDIEEFISRHLEDTYG